MMRLLLIPHHLSVQPALNLLSSINSVHGAEAKCVTLLDEPKERNTHFGTPAYDSYENFCSKEKLDADISYLYRKYPEINWAKIVAAERSFVDYSFLQGAAGNRQEELPYISDLVYRMTKFFERHFDEFKPNGVITAYGDNIFNLIAGTLAQSYRIRLFIPHPAFIHGAGNTDCGLIGNDIHLRSFRMERVYKELLKRDLSPEEVQEAEKISNEVSKYDGKKTLDKFYGKEGYEKPISPKVRFGLINYLISNARYDKDIAFFKIEPTRKIKANILRMLRNVTGRLVLGACANRPLPKKFVFYPMHYQPEASTLIAGIHFANQVALIENLSKILPLGYKLVVREHPRGRSFRPTWQYKHLSKFYNVQFSENDSKTLINSSTLVVTISGSSALEATAMDKPVVVLGENFHTYNRLYYKPKSIEDLERVFKAVLIDRDYEKITNRRAMALKFFLSYNAGLFQFTPSAGNESAILAEIQKDFASRDSDVSAVRFL